MYEEALAEELRMRHLKVERQFPLWISYKGRVLGEPARIGMRIDGLVLVESLAVTESSPRAEAQMRTYMQISGSKLGLIINFGEPQVKNGIQWVGSGVAAGAPEVINFKPRLKRKNPRDGQGWKPA